MFLLLKTPHFRAWDMFGKHFLLPNACRSVFPRESCQDAWRSSCLAMGSGHGKQHKTLWPNSFKFWSIDLQCVVRCHREKESDPFCWPILAKVVRFFWWVLLPCWVDFSDSECHGGLDQQQNTTSKHHLVLLQVCWERLCSILVQSLIEWLSPGIKSDQETVYCDYAD